MEKKILREIRFLKMYAIISTTLFLAFIFMSFYRQNGKQKFEEIDVQRINVVENDGALKMVISNDAMQHPGLINGKELAKRPRGAGMIFFNESGDECGGLVYDGTKKSAGLALSIDQFRNDQIMQLQYSQGENRKNASYGLKLWDRYDEYPLAAQLKMVDSLKQLKDEKIYEKEISKLVADGTFGHERLFVGKTKEQEVGLFIRDEKGRPRIKIFIDKNQNGIMQFLDSLGNAVPVHQP
ncbi:hypothetical protein [Pinibacter aurantiacus]|uniref:Uncharacterized protein n=1 Tax=Pinibacter aurantiacus TaxID=2851599 RepID=A0A9E2SFG4_9BACT|nr:hypothetical protein [Pinibacter aurantiacus]MBV4360080.1 hypothetical protein [Pinibacter aurantiacus]